LKLAVVSESESNGKAVMGGTAAAAGRYVIIMEDADDSRLLLLNRSLSISMKERRV
jgi:hypothetical protein